MVNQYASVRGTHRLQQHGRWYRARHFLPFIEDEVRHARGAALGRLLRVTHGRQPGQLVMQERTGLARRRDAAFQQGLAQHTRVADVLGLHEISREEVLHQVRRGLSVLVGGMCETDYSGYPDCRDDTLKAMQVALSLGLDSRFVLETPLMWLDKAATWQLAERLGGTDLVALIREETHSCYLGDRTHWHAWGYGCGHCPACALRLKGYEAYIGGKP